MKQVTIIKIRIYEIIEKASPGDILSKIFDIFIISLIFLNVIAVILETVKSFSSQYSYFFNTFEIISVIIFTTEYILRVWACTSDVRYKNPITGRLCYVITFFALVDLLAILPFYIPMIITFDLRFIRAVRLFRLFRLTKMGRYSTATKKISAVLKNKKEELFITLFTVFILLVIASSLMYYVEHETQPTAFSSIPAAMWWGMAALTTVGYGDVFPVTVVGKILGAIIAFLGIGMFALPAGIIASGFAEEVQTKNEKIFKKCPYCGKDI